MKKIFLILSIFSFALPAYAMQAQRPELLQRARIQIAQQVDRHWKKGFLVIAATSVIGDVTSHFICKSTPNYYQCFGNGLDITSAAIVCVTLVLHGLVAIRNSVNREMGAA